MDCQKHLFSIPPDVHYLNCAYFSPLMKSVEEAGIEGIRQKRTPWKVTPDEFFRNSDRLRGLFARLVNIPEPDRVAILPSASYGLSTVAKNLPREKGKNIVIAGEQFPSNVYPWMRYSGETGTELVIVEPPSGDNNRGERWNERLLEAITRDTLMVALGHVHWTDGTLFDLQKIGERAREVDALLVIDGTQSVGALPFDVQQVQPDALICAGYKWLMGPYSIGLGYFGERFRGGVPLEEGWIVRDNSEDFAGLVDYHEAYQPGAIRFDVGERSNFILVPMMIKALEQLLEWQPENIQAYCRELTSGIGEELASQGYRLESGERRSHHLFGIRLPGHIKNTELQETLSARNIHVSLRGSAVRISTHVYNDEQDIAALCRVLANVAENR